MRCTSLASECDDHRRSQQYQIRLRAPRIDEVEAQVCRRQGIGSRQFQAGGKRVQWSRCVTMRQRWPRRTLECNRRRHRRRSGICRNVLVLSDPRDVVRAIDCRGPHSEKMVQNLVWATVYNVMPFRRPLDVYRWGVNRHERGRNRDESFHDHCGLNAQLLRRVKLGPWRLMPGS